ncbi:host attachment protein [Azohydromonas lata]|uniref:Host attachment protein n=1 Tax=Azohydromonas lata TaxID=45677 RepID=A0ABU5IR49_9BURK|nr:host attachment protein [Azohydromonas lata]MDZ5461377.1 host attachment protein [Azohydromonas lata]
MSRDLILIAHASEARLLSRDRDTAELAALDTLRHQLRSAPSPLQRRAPDPRTDLASWAAPPDPRRRHWREFAAAIAPRVEAAVAQGGFERVALFAACPFLSELMRQLGPQVRKALKVVVDADVADLPPAELAQRIEQELLAADQAREGLARVAAYPVRA